MNVRCKFYVSSVLETAGHPDPVWTVVMIPIWEGADAKGENIARENHIFSKATPSGRLEMTIANEAAAKSFRSGECFYLDFTPAGKPAWAKSA